MLSERLGRWHFWLLVVGFNLPSSRCTSPGLLGMPRGIYTYPRRSRWDVLNLVTTPAFPASRRWRCSFIRQRRYSLRRGAPVGDNRGSLDARMGHDLSAARVQLCGAASDHEPAAAVGRAAFDDDPDGTS